MKIKKNGKVITLTESDLQKIVKRVISEESTDAENLYSSINSLIDREYSEMDPEDIKNVLHNIFNIYNAISYRKRRGRVETNRGDVMKRFS